MLCVLLSQHLVSTCFLHSHFLHPHVHLPLCLIPSPLSLSHFLSLWCLFTIPTVTPVLPFRLPVSSVLLPVVSALVHHLLPLSSAHHHQNCLLANGKLFVNKCLIHAHTHSETFKFGRAIRYVSPYIFLVLTSMDKN